MACISLIIGNLGKIGNYDVIVMLYTEHVLYFLVCMERGDP